MAAPVITVYRNGDHHFVGKKLVVNRRHIRNFETFLDKVTRDTRAGVAIRKIHTPHHGTKICSLEKIENGATYVAAGAERFRQIPYGKVVDHHISKPMNLAVKPVFRSRIIASSRYKKQAIAEPLRNRIIFLHRNGEEKAQPMKLLLDKRTLSNLNATLQYISDKASAAVKSIYTLDGIELKDVKEIVTNNHYVAVGSGKSFIKRKYRVDCLNVSLKKVLNSDKYISPRHKPFFEKSKNSMQYKDMNVSNGKELESINDMVNYSNISEEERSNSKYKYCFEVPKIDEKEIASSPVYDSCLSNKVNHSLISEVDGIVDTGDELADSFEKDALIKVKEISLAVENDPINDSDNDPGKISVPSETVYQLEGTSDLNKESIETKDGDYIDKFNSSEDLVTEHTEDDFSGTPPLNNLLADHIGDEVLDVLPVESAATGRIDDEDPDKPSAMNTPITDRNREKSEVVLLSNNDDINDEVSVKPTASSTPILDVSREIRSEENESSPLPIDNVGGDIDNGSFSKESVPSSGENNPPLYKASGKQKESGEEIEDDKKIAVEKTIDMIPADEVEEEINSSNEK